MTKWELLNLKKQVDEIKFRYKEWDRNRHPHESHDDGPEQVESLLEVAELLFEELSGKMLDES